MQIGIDLGGSHIAVGLIQEGRILAKKEKDLEEEKKQIEEIILKEIKKNIKEILEQEGSSLQEIEKIRNCSSWNLPKWCDNKS